MHPGKHDNMIIVVTMETPMYKLSEIFTMEISQITCVISFSAIFITFIFFSGIYGVVNKGAVFTNTIYCNIPPILPS